jgi:uncharacterized membrane protein
MNDSRPPGQGTKVITTLLWVLITLVALVLIARLVPVAIRAFATAGRSGAQAISQVGHPLLWIAGGAVVALLVLGLARRRPGPRRQGPRPPPN